ncbi:MAG: DUF6273 domain-containing protein [Bacilli bacterium]|nr:DUF6273 domain-containing protein [Bacilli bacterium]
MKRSLFILFPLLTISLLANCGEKDTGFYKIVWENYDGSVLETDYNVPKGDVPTYDGETPKRPNESTVEYTFSGWSPEVKPATSNQTYTATYKSFDKWWLDNNFISSLTEEDVGLTKEVLVEGVVHPVRLIGIDHDVIVEEDPEVEPGKAHTTWEFVNLISDANGYSIATPWNWEDGDGSTNGNFVNSTLRKALDGEGEAKNKVLQWYQKGESLKSEIYSGKCILDMLDSDLRSVLKLVEKPIGAGSYEAKLFLLSYRELSATSTSQYAYNEGDTYVYYKNHDYSEARIHKQISDTSLSPESVEITDGNTSCTDNYAGCFDPSTLGSALWLRSLYGYRLNQRTWYLETDGDFYVDLVWYNAYGVAPAFCI